MLYEAEDTDKYLPYSETEQGLVWHKETAQGAETILLTNFLARVTADVLEDDGTETHRMFEVEARLAGQSAAPLRGMITASEFSVMRWPVSLLGPQAIIFPNKSEHARCGIQSLSTDIYKRRVYAHTGWREVNGEWVYLHGGGAIGASGAKVLDVKLPNALEPFNLPAIPEREKLQEAFRASLRILRVASWHITVPILGAALSAALGRTDFTVSAIGPSGTGKTALTAIIQAHFGAGFGADNLPASWSSTGNALEGLAHVAKDALLVVDDFAATGTSQDIARMHREADRILRAQGNRSGRGRMRADGSLRPHKPPRGLILSTGEDVPKGQSLGARQLLVEMNKDSLNWISLSECQRAARDGVYATAMAGYICWLAGDYKNIQARTMDEVARIRELAAQSVAGHKRTPTTVAHLMRGWLYFLKAAVSYGALDEDEAKEFVNSIWKVLGEVATRQASHQETQEPAQRFIELLSAAIASGRAHLANTDGEYPDNPQALGWRPDGPTWRAQGVRSGWIDDKNVFIEPDAAYSIASSMAEALPVTQQTLWKRLRERGLLASVDEKRETLKVRRRLEGRNHSVLHINASLLLEGLPTAINPDKPDTRLSDDSNSVNDVGSLWSLLSGDGLVTGEKQSLEATEKPSIESQMSGLSGHQYGVEAET